MKLMTKTVMALMLISIALPIHVFAEIGRVGITSVFVSDLERAKEWYTQKLGFSLVEDNKFGPNPGDRWISVRAKNRFQL